MLTTFVCVEGCIKYLVLFFLQIGNFPPKMGKCSHGGPYDRSKDIPATGGINKETSSPELSPHFDLHKQAGEAATKATYDFLIGNGG